LSDEEQAEFINSWDSLTTQITGCATWLNACRVVLRCTV